MAKGLISFFSILQYAITPVLQNRHFQKLLATLKLPYLLVMVPKKRYRPFMNDTFARFFIKIKSLLDTHSVICSDSERSMSERSHASKSDTIYCPGCRQGFHV